MLTKQDLEDIEQSIDKKTAPRFKQAEKTLKSIQKDTKKILELFNFLDREHQRTRKRIDRVEDHLKLPTI